MTRITEGDLLTVSRALKLMPVSKSMLYKLINDGVIPAVRVRAAGGGRGRVLIHKDDLASFVARSRQGGTQAPKRVDVDEILAKVRKKCG